MSAYTVKKVSGLTLPGREFPARESFVSDIPAGDGKPLTFFTVYFPITRVLGYADSLLPGTNGAMLFRPRTVSPRRKSLGCPVPWTMCPLDDASPGRSVHGVPWTMSPLVRRVPLRQTDLICWNRLGGTNRANVFFCRLYPFSPLPRRQCLGPTCHLLFTNFVSPLRAWLSIWY